MDRDQVIERLKANRDTLRQKGVLHAAIFGSVARGEQTGESDIDILIELDPKMPMDVFSYVGLKRFIEGLFSGPVDIVNAAAFKKELRFGAALDTAYAF